MLPPDVRFKGINALKSISAVGSAPDLAGELTALPRPPSWILRGLLLREGEGRKGRGMRGVNERKGARLALVWGPRMDNPALDLRPKLCCWRSILPYIQCKHVRPIDTIAASEH